MNSQLRCLSVALAIGLAGVTSAFPQADKKTDDDKPADPDTGESTVEEKTLGILPQPLKERGVKFAATYIGEALGNLSGGLRRGSIFEGRLNLAVDLDLQKLAGWSQLSFHANVFQIHGQGLSRNYLQNYFVVSGIEALPSTRLYEAYFEKKWGSNDVSLKFGQLAADTKFFDTKYTDVLTNASMGWPAITSLNLLSGGPSPPLSAVGTRVLFNVAENWSFLGGIYDGNQAGYGTSDPQERNRYGLNFRVTDPPLILGQVQYAWNSKKGDPNLTGSIKLGGWQNFGLSNDPRFSSNGLSLASPLANKPAALRGNAGIWAVFEQQIYKVPKSDDRGIGIFARVSSSPSPTSLIDVYADGGVEFIGLSNNRPDDKFGVAAGYAHVAKRARSLDNDFNSINTNWPQRTYEGLFTAVYQYQVRDGWTVQPNFQYVIRPGAGATDPLGANPGRSVRNASVLGLRSTLKF